MSIETANSITASQVKDMFLYVGEKVIESKPLLTKIDSAIGDGDHGIGMSVGFTKAAENLKANEFTTVNDVFKTVGMSMISSMGGASGVIFGTMFVGGIKGLEPKTSLDLQLLASIYDKALEAIKLRGKADLGDKTMIDAFQPVVETLKVCANKNESLVEGLKQAEIAALQGVENTKDYVAKFGRAKSLGERAIGHQDAGATTVSIIIKSMKEWLEGQGNE
ncbi:dihydroxyacetone kinase subunit DhaL [Pseudalkalibacillus salsuginis]|uniref:dihydroxyacetone kinase subunit DhaL n=1 Tax=Pseudalkalibacillus salsuginis TaxID=2910972 RepID=UPI001F421961|nr:dihydroxyacetone kinase subunit DhaL [Pseudalkalibacillus salsuginis]MCF6410747.1 dihydroxyacetone kinase subunit L [Pseudalkalibacillus salsuginis]